MSFVTQATVPAALTGAVNAIRPDPDEARSWVERELSRPEYQRSLIEQFFSWIGDLWDELTQAALGASPLGTGAAVIVLAVLVALTLAVAGRVRREPTVRRSTGAAVVGQGGSPATHRAAAERALEAGDLEAALVESFRTVASRSAQRGLLEDRPGLTAHEVAVELGRVFPSRAADLADAATSFDRVFYGDQSADAADARAVLRLDDELSRSRPELAEVRPHAEAPR